VDRKRGIKSRLTGTIGSIRGQGQGAMHTAQYGFQMAKRTAAGKYIAAHPKRSAVAGLMGAGALTSKRRGRGASPTRGVPRGIYKY